MNGPPQIQVAEARGRKPRRFPLPLLAACLPAMLGVTAAVAVALTAMMSDPANLTKRYRAEFERSLKAKEFREARICAERLTLLENESSESQLRLVGALYDEGDLQR